LADTQDVSSKMQSILEKLKIQKIKLFLVGNWAHIASLKTEFPDVFKLFDGVFVSGDLHILKPSLQYYNLVLERSGIAAGQALWIETEPKFITLAKSYGLQVASYSNEKPDELVKALRSYGILV
jgi:2-haloacid dehalogenase